MALMKKLTWCSVVNNFYINAKHIPGKCNFSFSDEEIPQFSTQCETGTNVMCDIPTADIDLKLSNEVDQLLDAAVSEQTAKSYKTTLDHFISFV